MCWSTFPSFCLGSPYLQGACTLINKGCLDLSTSTNFQLPLGNVLYPINCFENFYLTLNCKIASISQVLVTKFIWAPGIGTQAQSCTASTLLTKPFSQSLPLIFSLFLLLFFISHGLMYLRLFSNSICS